MPVPAKRRSRSKARRNRAHEALKPIKLNVCPKCSKAVEPHHACLFCGSYKGKDSVKVKGKAIAKPAKVAKTKKKAA